MKRLFMPLLLCGVLLALTMPGSAMLAPQMIRSVDAQFAQEISIVELDGDFLSAHEMSDLTVSPGSGLHIYLTAADGSSLFYDQNDDPLPTADVTLSRLRAAQVTIDVSGDTGIVHSAELAYSYQTANIPSASPYIDIQFVREVESLQDLDFELQVSLVLAGQELPQSQLELRGTVRMNELELYEGDREADIRDGIIALARTSAAGVAIQISEDVVVYAQLREGERYYGVVQQQQAGEGVLHYQLHTVNLDKPGNTVRIYTDQILYVYDAQRAYIGTTRDVLPYSDQYYLTDVAYTDMPLGTEAQPLI